MFNKMKVIKDNNINLGQKKPKNATCRWCKSVLEYEKSDITRGSLILSQREEYNNIQGLNCPCCDKFTNI